MLALALALLLPAVVGTLRAADASALQEHELKALYLFNFTKYVEWPEQPTGDTNSFLVGVVGAPDVEASLIEATRGKDVGGKPVVVRRFEPGGDLRGCRIVYVGLTDRGQVDRLMEGLRDQPALTVGEGEIFLDRGGMIGFVRKDKKIRLFVGLEKARRSGLRVSAKLLGVAEGVRDGKSR
jgi:hypothetical protein